MQGVSRCLAAWRISVELQDWRVVYVYGCVRECVYVFRQMAETGRDRGCCVRGLLVTSASC